jgi:hypothetical protein
MSALHRRPGKTNVTGCLKGSVAAALALLTVAASPAAACDKGAVKTVEAMYKVYQGDEIFNNFDPAIYSARLRPAVESWLARCEGNPEGEGCMLDGNFFVDGNDVKLSKVKARCLSGDAGKSRVLVQFRNFDTPSTKVFDMVKEGDRWLIDEIADSTDGKGFLGDIFKAP